MKILIEKNLNLGLIILLASKTIFAHTSSICAAVPNGYFVRSSQSCDSYNRCINGQVKCVSLQIYFHFKYFVLNYDYQPSHGVCPRGFSFNPLSQTCSHNIDVDCHSCSSYGIQNIPHPDNCAMYYRCVNGKISLFVLPDIVITFF